MTLRELEKQYQELKYYREDTVIAMRNDRLSDYDYNALKRELDAIDRELDEIEAELDNQNRVNQNFRGERSSSNSFGSGAFNTMSRRSNTPLPTDDIGSVRLKNQPLPKKRDPLPSGSRRTVEPQFQTKVAMPQYFSIDSLYPYITAEGVTIKEEVANGFKQRVFYGESINRSALDVKDLSMDMEEGDDVGDITKYMSSNTECNYLVAGNQVYVGKISSVTNRETTMIDILINEETLERSFGLHPKFVPFINSYVSEVLNDMLVLNNQDKILDNMYQFKTMLTGFGDVKTVVIKEIKNSINNILLTIEDNTLSVDVNTPTVYGFPVLEKAIGESENGVWFVSSDTHPDVFNALSDIAKETESNIIKILTSKGKKLKVVISLINNKAVIREDCHLF